MSFNIRNGLADDGNQCWENRKGLVASRIRAFGPDLLGLQECRDDAQAAFLKRMLPEYQFFGTPRGGGDETSREMTPVLFRKSRFRSIGTGSFWLSASPLASGSKGWDADFPRTATWVELVEEPSGRRLFFLSTHFDYQPEAVRQSARLLQAWRREIRHPVIVAGDFNADKNSFAYRRLTGELSDAHQLARPESFAEATFHGFGQTGEAASMDWILVSGHFAVSDASVDRCCEGGVFPSDHYPVRAELAWKEHGQSD